MKTNFRVTDPDDMPCTMTITMTLKQWKEVSDAFGTQARPAPVHQLQRAIRQAVIHVGDRFDYDDPAGNEAALY